MVNMNYSKQFFLVSLLCFLTGLNVLMGQVVGQTQTPTPTTSNSGMSRTSHTSSDDGDNGGNNLPIRCIIKHATKCGVVYSFRQYLEITPDEYPFLAKDMDIEIIGNNGQAATVSNIEFYLLDPIQLYLGNISKTKIGLPHVIDFSWATFNPGSPTGQRPVNVYVTFDVEFCEDNGELADNYDFDFNFSGKYLSDEEGSAEGEESQTGSWDEFSLFTEDFSFTTSVNVAVLEYSQADGYCQSFFDGAPAPNDPEPMDGYRSGFQPSWNAVVYPNPSASFGILSLSLNQSASYEIQVLDVNGRSVIAPLSGFDLVPGEHSIKLRTEALSPGMYVIKIRVADEIKSLKYLKIAP